MSQEPGSGEGGASRIVSAAAVDDPGPRPRPIRRTLTGGFVDLEPLDAERHGRDLWEAADAEDAGRASWTWLPYGPFADAAALAAWIAGRTTGDDPLLYAVRERSHARVSGFVGLLNIRPEDAVLEIGHIWLSPRLQRTTAATEAIALLLRHVFDDLAYRRVEWKCNACNGASRSAALRLGFVFEGVFFRHMIVKGRNRDTAWYSMLDEEWSARRAALASWLAPANFDAHGRQRAPLSRREETGEAPARP